MKWTKPGHQFDDIGSFFIGKKIVIYGANENGKEFFNKVKFLDAVEVFIDKNEKYQSEGVCGKPVVSIHKFTDMDSNGYIVVVAIQGYYRHMVINQLLHLGYTLGRNIFTSENFLDHYLSIFSVYEKNLVYFPSISFLVTTKCNLNCFGCLNFTHENKNKKHYDIYALKRSADTFFASVDFVEKFHISGGEPLMYTHLDELIEYIHMNYCAKIGQIFVATNGTIIPSERLCNILKGCDVFVEIDDYRNSLHKSMAKNDKLISLFHEYDISHLDRATDYWINLNPDSSIDKCDDVALENWYDTCNNPYASFHDDCLYSCNYDDYAKEAGLTSPRMEDIMKFGETSFANKKILVEFRHGYTSRGYVEFCKKCAGHEMTNQHHIAVAQQIERK